MDRCLRNGTPRVFVAAKGVSKLAQMKPIILIIFIVVNVLAISFFMWLFYKRRKSYEAYCVLPSLVIGNCFISTLFSNFIDKMSNLQYGYLAASFIVCLIAAYRIKEDFIISFKTHLNGANTKKVFSINKKMKFIYYILYCISVLASFAIFF